MTTTAVLLPLSDALRTTPVAQWRWAQDYRGPCRTTVVVPAQAVSWHQVQLPGGSLRPATRLRAVLEGLLEDQLLDDPAELHFALPPQAATGQRVWVAVCARSWLRDALGQLEQQGHSVQAVVPEFAPTDGAPAYLSLMSQADHAVAVWSDAHGVHQRPLHEHQRSADALPSALHGLPVFAEPALADWARDLHLGDVTLQPVAQRLAAAAQSPWDLAQGELSRRHPALRRLERGAMALWQSSAWRPARWAVYAMVGVQLVGLNAAAWQARSGLQAQRAALTRTLLETFPSTPVVVDAPLQMERAVAALRTAQGSISAKDLESQLQALASTPTFQAAGATPQHIEFVAGQLRVQGLGLGDEALQNLQRELRPRGYSVSQQADTLQMEVVRTP